jgi:tellurite resistance protein
LKDWAHGTVLIYWAVVKPKPMDFKEVLTNLYFTLIWSDGEVNEKEISYGRKMAEIVGIEEAVFLSRTKNNVAQYSGESLTELITSMRMLTREEQIQCIAWLCVIANADGFMDKTEWQVIYRIYYKELQLPLDEIMQMQKTLNRLLLRKHFSKVTVQ